MIRSVRRQLGGGAHRSTVSGSLRPAKRVRSASRIRSRLLRGRAWPSLSRALRSLVLSYPRPVGDETTGDGLKHSQKRDEPTRRTIRVFPDYGRDWPLWENTTDEHDYGYTMSPSDYGLSVGLTERLAEWNDLWESNFESQGGWISVESRAEWARLADGIIADLRTEVYWLADVKYEPWPLGE